jgi:hypothetical protein
LWKGGVHLIPFEVDGLVVHVPGWGAEERKRKEYGGVPPIPLSVLLIEEEGRR